MDELERILPILWGKTLIVDGLPVLRTTTAHVVRVTDGHEELPTVPAELIAILPSSCGDRPTPKAQAVPVVLVDGDAKRLELFCEQTHAPEVLDRRLGIGSFSVGRRHVAAFFG